MLNPKAVLHGLLGHKTELSPELAAEVNRIEAQLSLMLSHVEGAAASEIAMLKVQKTLVPFSVGVVVGAIATLVVSLIR